MLNIGFIKNRMLGLIISQTDDFIQDRQCMFLYYLHIMWIFNFRLVITQDVGPLHSSEIYNYGNIHVPISWEESNPICCKGMTERIETITTLNSNAFKRKSRFGNVLIVMPILRDVW